MTLFEKCTQAAMAIEWAGEAYPESLCLGYAEDITRAILTTIRDNSPSPRAVGEMIRILEEGGE